MENSVALGIIFKLMKGKRSTAMEIANEFEISPRTVYRYIDTLSASGIPIITYNGKNGGIEIDNKFELSKSFLTQDEIEYLLGVLKGDKKNAKSSVLIEKFNHFFEKNN